MWLGPLPGPALGWPASASRLGHAGLQFFGASALAAHRPGGLFPPQASAPRSRRSIARCCCGCSKTSCSGSSRPTKLPTFVPGGSNEVVLEQQLTNQALHHRRLRIEHVNSSVKRCRIVKDRIRLWKEGVRDLVMELCCALHNFRVRLNPWLPMV